MDQTVVNRTARQRFTALEAALSIGLLKAAFFAAVSNAAIGAVRILAKAADVVSLYTDA